jgi:hypothetical protein
MNVRRIEFLRVIRVVVLGMPLKPSDVLFVFGVGRVAQDLQKAVVARNAPTVLGRASSLPADASRVFNTFLS